MTAGDDRTLARPAPRPNRLRWRLSTFTELDAATLYAVLRLREEVFIVEQRCAYLDADGRDQSAWHLLGWSAEGEPTSELLAYARLLPPDGTYQEPAIGRIVTAPRARGLGIGHLLVDQAILRAEELFGQVPIRIGAQSHLAAFYEAHGFARSGPPYDEDGIEHIPMLREPAVAR